MSAVCNRVLAWLPVLIWMVAIFIGSTDVLSSQQTSRFIGPFLRWLKPDISDEAVQTVQFVVRKCGHLTVYAILSVLVRRALDQGTRLLGPWDGRKAAAAFGLATAYAVTDELHQHFVATRYGTIGDVAIDAAGAALGLGLIRLVLQIQICCRPQPTADLISA